MTHEPLVTTRQSLLRSEVTQAVLQESENAIRREIDLASREAQSDPFADPETVTEHMYV